jgi:hypothetical protein
VRGAKAYAAITLGPDGGMLIRPGSRFVCAGIAAVAFGFALGVRAMSPGVPVSEATHPKGLDARTSLGSQNPYGRGWRVASLDTGAAFGLGAEETNRRCDSESAVAIWRALNIHI